MRRSEKVTGAHRHPLAGPAPPLRAWQTVYKRFARWQTDGTWTRIEAALRAQADAAGELDWHGQIDSTVVRAHRSRQDASKRWDGHAVG